MARTPGRLFHVTSLARRDIAAILKRSFQEFGMSAALRYKALIRQALLDIEADPERQGTRERPEIMVEGARTYHITLEREDGVVEIARVLHESRDLDRHLPERFRRTSTDE